MDYNKFDDIDENNNVDSVVVMLKEMIKKKQET